MVPGGDLGGAEVSLVFGEPRKGLRCLFGGGDLFWLIRALFEIDAGNFGLSFS